MPPAKAKTQTMPHTKSKTNNNNNNKQTSYAVGISTRSEARNQCREKVTAKQQDPRFWNLGLGKKNSRSQNAAEVTQQGPVGEKEENPEWRAPKVSMNAVAMQYRGFVFRDSSCISQHLPLVW